MSLALGLASIAAAKDYELPTKPPLATLTVDNQTQGGIKPATFANPENCRGMQSFLKDTLLVKRSLGAGNAMTVPIDAGREFNLSVESIEGGARGVMICTVIVAFKPEEGGRYTAKVISDHEHCGLLIFREMAAEDGTRTLVKEPSARRRETPAVTIKFGPQCVRDQAAAKDR